MPTGYDGSTQQATCHSDRVMHAKGLCKECYFSKYNSARIKSGIYKKYPSHSKEAKRKARLKELGWTLELWEKAWKEHDGKCANSSCKKTLNLSVTQNSARACADHEHTTLKPRGILCSTCNIMLGQAQDNPEILRGGAEYLEKFSLAMSAEETKH